MSFTRSIAALTEAAIIAAAFLMLVAAPVLFVLLSAPATRLRTPSADAIGDSADERAPAQPDRCCECSEPEPEIAVPIRVVRRRIEPSR